MVTQEAESATQATDTVRVRDVVSRCGALASERPRTSYATKNLEQDLGRLLRSGNVEQHRDVLDRPLAASALAGEPYSAFDVQSVDTESFPLQSSCHFFVFSILSA